MGVCDWLLQLRDTLTGARREQRCRDSCQQRQIIQLDCEISCITWQMNNCNIQDFTSDSSSFRMAYPPLPNSFAIKMPLYCLQQDASTLFKNKYRERTFWSTGPRDGTCQNDI